MSLYHNFRLVYFDAGRAIEGGSVNYSHCGAVCGTHAQETQWIGWIGAIVAIVFFGSNYIPVKTFDTGDGTLCVAW